LTGVFPPTSGEATVGGCDIATNIDQAHLVMGVCPQFNILWDQLTVEEHLLFYTRLKGIPSKLEKDHVTHALTQVGLNHVATRLSSALSGGMKRRLSVAISLVGDSAIVFLDEPTTGLDPTSRRQLWKILQRVKRGRAIILTTHAMDEAELLCSRIGIIALGKLRCIGTSTHLKNRHGGGYRLQMNYRPDMEEVATKTILSIFPEATPCASFRGTRSYLLPPTSKWQGRGETVLSDLEGETTTTTTSSNVDSFSQRFSELLECSKRSGINDFAISQLGVEDVFQRIVEESHKEPHFEESN